MLINQSVINSADFISYKLMCYIFRLGEKLFLLLLLLINSDLLNNTCFAGDISLNGSFVSQGAVNQSITKHSCVRDVSKKNHKLVFYSKANIKTKFSDINNQGLEYGAIIDISVSPYQNISSTGSHLYLEFNEGRLEGGFNKTAMSSMSTSADNIAGPMRSDNLKYLLILETANEPNAIERYYNNLSDYSLITSGLYGNNRSPNITYYTPSIKGLQLGISFAPYAVNLGNIRACSMENCNSRVGINSKNYDIILKNIISSGLNYILDINDDAAIKFGVGVEYGRAFVTPELGGIVSANDKLSDYNIYNAGLIYTYGNYSLGASYADAGRSFLSASLESKVPNIKNKFYTAGAAYDQGPFGASLTYFLNDKFNGLLKTGSLSAYYKFRPGILAYVEASRYQYKLKKFRDPPQDDQNRFLYRGGNVYMLGFKLFF